MILRHTFLILFGLGFYHGINPAMGWLLATSLGLQKKSLVTLLGAIGALTAGHLVAVALAVFGFREIQKPLPNIILEWTVAALLIGFGLYHLVKRGHKVWLGMRSSLAAVVFLVFSYSYSTWRGYDASSIYRRC